MSWKRPAKCLLTLAIFAFLLTGCQDAPPTGATDESNTTAAQGPGSGGPPDQAAPEATINNLIKDLFPQPEKRQAHQLFADTKSALSQGDTEAAQESALDLLELALGLFESDELKDPPGQQTTGEALGELVDTLLTFVGLDAAGATDVLTGDVDGVVAIASADEDNTIVTEQEFAGTVIEEEDLEEDRLVVIERILQAEQDGLPQGDCLPTGEDQAEGCYRFDKSPDDPFQDEVVVGVCPEDFIRNQTGNGDQYQLGKFDPDFPGDGVVALPSESAPFLDCAGFTVASAGGGGLWPLIEGGWNATGDRVLSWLAPEPLWAVDSGLGGSSINWSRIGWFRPLDVQITAGDGQTDFAGFPVLQDPTVQVVPAHTGSPPLQGVNVSFTVTGGGGSVASSSVTTNSNGLASVEWTLGSSNPNTLDARVSGDSETFTATAIVPAPVVHCQVGGGADRVLNLVTASTVGRAFYHPAYPASSVSQLDLWFTSDSAGTYDVHMTVRQGGFTGTILDTTTVPVTVDTDPTTFTKASFGLAVSGLSSGTTLAFQPRVTDGPQAEFFFEVPVSDNIAGFTLPGDANCPLIETNEVTAPVTDRRQGVKANIFN